MGCLLLPEEGMGCTKSEAGMDMIVDGRMIYNSNWAFIVDSNRCTTLISSTFKLP